MSARSPRTSYLLRCLLLVPYGLFFFVPLLALLDFSTKPPGQSTRTATYYTHLLSDPELVGSIKTSLLLSLFTVVLMLGLLVPTMIWVRLRVPKANRLIEFLCLMPLTIPALVIVVGIKNVYAWVTYFLGDSGLTLTFAYVILVLPYAYRSIDSALSAINVVTLSEAARSLGAGWPTVFTRIVVPNITSGLMSAAFVAVALVMGEYTFASLLNFVTLPTEIALVGKSAPQTSMALSLVSILFVALLLVLLSFLDRRAGHGRKADEPMSAATPPIASSGTEPRGS